MMKTVHCFRKKHLIKIILTAIGTQGDIEPFIAIGKILKEKGHHVICAFSEQFRELTEDHDLEFASLGQIYFNLFESDDGRLVMGGGKGFKKFFTFIKLAINQASANKEKELYLYELIKISRISNKNLEPKILELLNNKSFKDKSEIIGNKMKQEDYTEELYKTIIE